MITKSLLTQLSIDDCAFAKASTEDMAFTNKTYPLHSYVRRYWWQHAKSAPSARDRLADFSSHSGMHNDHEAFKNVCLNMSDRNMTTETGRSAIGPATSSLMKKTQLKEIQSSWNPTRVTPFGEISNSSKTRYRMEWKVASLRQPLTGLHVASFHGISDVVIRNTMTATNDEGHDNVT